MLTRRHFIQSSGAVLASIMTASLPQVAASQNKTNIREIRMESDPDGARVWFDPIGLYIKPGTKVRWIVHHNTHTVAAYHPHNSNHSLRIPEKAKPWDSGFLVEPGENFTLTLTEPGVYDYYCMPHEDAGMVGRIVVGEISGPGAEPYDYFKKLKNKENWEDVPESAQCVLPPPKEIMQKKIINYSFKSLVKKCNL